MKKHEFSFDLLTLVKREKIMGSLLTERTEGTTPSVINSYL